eukprot:113961_1
MSAPKKVNVYHIDGIDKDFLDFQSKKPNRSVKCSANKLKIGQKILVKNTQQNTIKFKQTKCLAIYIQSNQSNSETTFVNSIKLHGKTHCHVMNINKIGVFDKTCAENRKIYHEMGDLFGKIDFADVIIDSLHLLKSSTTLKAKQQSTNNENKCNLSDCHHLKQIIDILQTHNVILSDKKPNLDFEKYNNMNIINHFDHLLRKHEHQFDDIYTNITNIVHNGTKCDLLGCFTMKRHHRDRNPSKNDLHELQIKYNNVKDVKDIVKQQFIDRIHCYYSHSIDTGYRLSEYDKANIISNNNDEVKNNNDGLYDPLLPKISQLLADKKSLLERAGSIPRLNGNESYNKFVSVVNTNKNENININGSYSFGIRYYYWRYYYKNNAEYDATRWTYGSTEDEPANNGYTLGDWYIAPKYKNLKDEMLNNEICIIGKGKWDVERVKADYFLLSAAARDISCMRSSTLIELIYGIKYQQPITFNHLMAIVLHCNQDKLQEEFNKTCRRVPWNESDKDLIARHRNYHWFGKLLRECVELFGHVCGEKLALRFGNDFHDTTFYHG